MPKNMSVDAKNIEWLQHLLQSLHDSCNNELEQEHSVDVKCILSLHFDLCEQIASILKLNLTE